MKLELSRQATTKCRLVLDGYLRKSKHWYKCGRALEALRVLQDRCQATRNKNCCSARLYCLEGPPSWCGLPLAALAKQTSAIIIASTSSALLLSAPIVHQHSPSCILSRKQHTKRVTTSSSTLIPWPYSPMTNNMQETPTSALIPWPEFPILTLFISFPGCLPMTGTISEWGFTSAQEVRH